jgi:hypothetical protein
MDGARQGFLQSPALGFGLDLPPQIVRDFSRVTGGALRIMNRFLDDVGKNLVTLRTAQPPGLAQFMLKHYKLEKGTLRRDSAEGTFLTVF